MRLCCLAMLLGIAAPALAADAPAAFEPAPLAIGASWYPEQWPEDRWDTDLTLMQRAHLKVVRIGEFAWSRMEPSDGQFEFGWLDRAIVAAGRHGIRVVLGTPTAAPPVWLTEAHPDVLRVNADGSVEGHGERRQFSFASATYRRYAMRIAGEMAKRYGHNPNVVGWQIDNEIGVPSFDGETKAAWGKWLGTRYGTVDALNRRWTTEYWSQHYDRFDQVPLTSSGPQNPALILDFYRFASDVWADYVAVQVRAIRALADPRQFVTTNSTAWNDNFDQYRVHRELDMAAWDDYVPDGRPDWSANALHHDLVRGYKQRNFWVMETQPGRVDWAPTNRSLDPGQTRELAWQAVAHGADAVLYWQWRSAMNGQEQYHGTLLGPGGDPMPIFDEIARTAREMAIAAPYLAGARPARAEVALIYSQEGRWAIEQERHARAYDPVAVMKDWYRPLAAAGVAVDVLPPDADLSRYRLVMAPQINVLDEATASRLTAYVRAGGHLVLGPRSGMKDGDNALWPQRQPGPLTMPLGTRVEYYYPLDSEVSVIGAAFTGASRIWAETLDDGKDATVIARYGSEGWLSGKPAIVSRTVGKGAITYDGALLDAAGQAGLTRWALTQSGAATGWVLSGSPDVEVTERGFDRAAFLIVINHGITAAILRMPTGASQVVGDLQGVALPAHGVTVLRLQTPARPPKKRTIRR